MSKRVPAGRCEAGAIPRKTDRVVFATCDPGPKPRGDQRVQQRRAICRRRLMPLRRNPHTPGAIISGCGPPGCGPREPSSLVHPRLSQIHRCEGFRLRESHRQQRWRSSPVEGFGRTISHSRQPPGSRKRRLSARQQFSSLILSSQSHCSARANRKTVITVTGFYTSLVSILSGSPTRVVSAPGQTLPGFRFGEARFSAISVSTPAGRRRCF